MNKRTSQRGSAMVEFALAGVASIFLLISTFHLAMGILRRPAAQRTHYWEDGYGRDRYGAVSGVRHVEW